MLVRGGGRKSLKVLKGEVKVLFVACFGHISIKIMLNRQRRKNEKNAFRALENHRSATVRGGAPGAPPPRIR